MYSFNKENNGTINDSLKRLVNYASEYNKKSINLDEYNKYYDISKRKLQPALILLRHSIRLDSDMARNLGINQNWSDKETRPFDTPLLEPKGIELAKNTAISIKNRGIIIDKIICSPLRRCIQTAIEVAKVFNIKEIKIDNRVMEDGKIVGDKLKQKNQENKKNKKPLLELKMTLISDDEIKKLGGDIKFIKPTINSKESIIPKLDEDGEGFRKRLYTVIDEEITSDNSNPNNTRTIIIGHGGSIGFMADRIKNNKIKFNGDDFCAWIGIFKNSNIVEFGNLSQMNNFL